MPRITRTILWAIIFGALTLLAQAQENRPELKAITSASTPSAQQGQVSTVAGLTIPVLTIDEAVALATKGNRQVRSAALSVDAAQQETAATRTSRWPQFQTYLLGGEALRPISFSIPKGALGVYPATGPIPPPG